MNKELIRNLLDTGNYITVNKIIIKKLGLLEAVLLGDFISKYNYFSIKNQLTEYDEFFNTIQNIIEDTGITKHQLNQTMQTLEDHNIISIIKKGIPAKNYYKLNFEKIENIFQSSKNQSTSKLKNKQQEDYFSNDINKIKDNKNKLTNINNKESDKSDSNNDLINRIKENKNNTIPKEKDNFTLKILNEYYEALIKIYPNEKKEDIINSTEIKIVESKIKYFINGLSINKYGFLYSNNFLEELKIRPDIEDMKNGFGKLKIHKLLKNALLIYDPEYNPTNKSKLPKKLSYFITEPNRKTMKSHLLFYGYNPPKPLLTVIKNPFPKELQMIKEQCFSNTELTIKQENELIRTLKDLNEFTKSLRTDYIVCKHNNKRYTREQIDYGKFQQYVVSFTGFIDCFLTFLNEKKEGWKDFETGIYSFKMQGQIWNEFKVWMETMDCPLNDINLEWYMNRKIDELIKSGELVIPEKTKDEQIIELQKLINDSSEGSANRDMFTERLNLLQGAN